MDAARTIAASIVADGGKACGVALDVTDEDGCRKLAQDLVAGDGRERWITRALASERAPDGVRVNALEPGLIPPP